MDTEANSVAAGCGGRSPPEGGLESDPVSIIPKQAQLARAKWLELFFKKFRGTKATVLGSDCCELVKLLGLDSQSFASMTELLEEAEEEEDNDWDESYKTAVSSEIDIVLASLHNISGELLPVCSIQTILDQTMHQLNSTCHPNHLLLCRASA